MSLLVRRRAGTQADSLNDRRTLHPYTTRDQARADVFDYIEVFYNRQRRHGYLGNISPADFEERPTGSFVTVH